ncbi:response regulator transcription factor [Leucobacter tenebrionis]|uniref:response regulator transcription factor n=1 Tax=Leucobacter tenebrionis TaxID=2873270 RepID=UPI001CA678CC|nr:response regulator transcription factor [Leucobacter tenebrionis]QZY51507.1 response regulator transcription factor [Leucobacter tenebrionis]
MIRIGIVEDHPAMTLGTATVLNARPDLRVVAAGKTVRELLARRQAFDVVLLDLTLNDGTTPAQNIAALNAKNPVPILAYTAGDRPGLIREAARAGVAGMVRKSETPEAVAQAVRRAVAGDVVSTADWAAALESDPNLEAAGLTQRETEVLSLYASGETAERVAEFLGISVETVIDHIKRIRRRYAAVDRPAPTKIDLFRRAREDGLIPGA